jgi:hypothetical protein
LFFDVRLQDAVEEDAGLAVGLFWEEAAGDLLWEPLWLAVEQTVGVDGQRRHDAGQPLRFLVGVGPHGKRHPSGPAGEGQPWHCGPRFGLGRDEVVFARQLLVQLCQSGGWCSRAATEDLFMVVSRVLGCGDRGTNL